MLRLIARRMGYISVNAGSDKVLFGITLPSDSVVHSLRAKIQLVANTDVLRGVATMNALEGWVLPLLDPDAGAALNTIWDQLVPKDSDVLTLDLDTGAVDTSPFFEPGEVELSAMFDVGLRPRRVYHRHRLHTLNGAIFSYQDNQASFLVKYTAGDRFEVNLKQNIRVSQPSVLVFAVASPQMDDTDASAPNALSEAELPQVKYFGDMLKRAMLDVLGVVEAGAETPWEEASALMVKHLDPDVYEETAGAIEAMTWNCWFEVTIDHSVEGTLNIGTVSTGR